MESNKSKGVRNVPEKIYLQVGIWDPSEDESYDFSKLAGNGGVTWCADRIDETDIEYSLAHPQQSEGVEQRTADKLLTETEIFIQRERKICWEAEYQNDEYCVGENALRAFIKRISREYPTSLPQPSEPAALKEFYCIGDKDNLFQCEEQCEDCKKGAALKDGEITDGEIEGTIRQLWEKWQFEGKVFYHEFEFALKEFYSLLNQKR